MGRGNGAGIEPPNVGPRVTEPGRPPLEPLPTARELMQEVLPHIAWVAAHCVYALVAPEAKREARERAALHALGDLRTRLGEFVITR